MDLYFVHFFVEQCIGRIWGKYNNILFKILVKLITFFYIVFNAIAWPH
jgi:hypothetical protein